MISILAAPTNLGLRPPQPTSVPGCAKAPEALREAGLHRRLLDGGGRDVGAVLPGRYVDDLAVGSGRVRNQDALIDHALRLAARIAVIMNAGGAPLILGGDCSLLVGAGVALSRRGRFGLVHIDGHSDFRHPGNSTHWASVAGEDLAVAVGMHIPELSNIDGLSPYFEPAHVAHVGCRDDDELLGEARELLAVVIPASQWISDPAGTLATLARTMSAEDLDGYWLHVDVDVLDPSLMPAVDSPDPGGVDPDQLTTLLSGLARGAVGAQICIFDPDLDPDGQYAQLLTDVIVGGLGALAVSSPLGEQR